MAMYYDLPVYRDGYTLILKIFEVTKDFPREFEYSLGPDMTSYYTKAEVDALLAGIKAMLPTRCTQVAAGFDHTCGGKKSGTVACWGLNEFGESTPPHP